MKIKLKKAISKTKKAFLVSTIKRQDTFSLPLPRTKKHNRMIDFYNNHKEVVCKKGYPK